MRRPLWLFAVACLVCAPAWALPEQTWVVAISNNRGEANELALLYADRDAQQFAQAMQVNGGVSPLRTVVMSAAKAEEVRDTILALNARIRETAEGKPTALVIFYSGHADAQSLHLAGSRLRLEELEAMVRGSAATVRLLVIDSCRSGTVTRVKGVRPAPEFEMNVQGEVATEGMAIITSSAAGEWSQESDELRGSFFTHHLVNALRGAADQNEDGRITLAEAYAYTYAQTLRSSGRTAALQHPTYAYDVKGKGELVLANPETGGKTGRLRLVESTTYIVSEEHEGGPVLAEVTPAREAATLALPEGKYFIQERLPTEYREYDVNVAAGGELSLAALPYRRIRYDQLVRKRGAEQTSVHGLFLLGAGRGEVLPGERGSPQVLAGYSLDLPWFTLQARLRGATASGLGPEGQLPRRHDELGVGLALQRFVDFSAFSLGFGLLTEAVLHQQTFSGTRDAPTRDALGGGFGGLISIERHLVGGLALHVEGGPMTLVFREAQVREFAVQGDSLASPFTWWAAGGLIWRL